MTVELKHLPGRIAGEIEMRAEVVVVLPMVNEVLWARTASST
jgi:hypothetical protein